MQELRRLLYLDRWQGHVLRGLAVWGVQELTAGRGRRAWSTTKPFAKAIQAHADTIRLAQDAVEDADFDVQAATGEIAVLNDDLGKAFRPLTLGLDQLVGGVADDPRWRRLFPTTPSEALKPTVGDDQSQFVDDVLKVLTNEGDFETLKPHAAAIVAAHDALKAKVAERAGLRSTLALAESNLAKVVQAACIAHNESEPDVKKLVESFFYKFPPAAKKVAAPE